MLQDVPTMLGGRYRVLERLGRGGMADVYRAEDVVLGRIVAIKVFRGGVERDVHLARFRTEVRTLAALTHPHLVALYDAGGDITEPWCAMEYVDGGSLADREGGMAPGPSATVGEQVASALGYVHARGIVHRDVKPSNVLLGRGGDAFLSDFGVARLTDGTRMTQSGLMIGTAAFLSPEQVRGLAAGPAADLYALGLVLLELLTGEREYPGAPVESAVARLSRPPRVPDRFGAEWARLLGELTAEEPADRPDAATAARRLRAIAEGLAGSPLADHPQAGAVAGAGAGAGADPAGRTDPDATVSAGAPVAGGPAGLAPAVPAPAAPGLRVWRLRVPRRALTAVGAGSLLAVSGLVALVMLGGVKVSGFDPPGPVPSSPTTVDPTSTQVAPSGGGLAGDPIEARRLPVGPLQPSTSIRPVAPLPPAPRVVATTPVASASTSRKPSTSPSSVPTSPSPTGTPTSSATTPVATTTPPVTSGPSSTGSPTPTAVTTGPSVGSPTPTSTASR